MGNHFHVLVKMLPEHKFTDEDIQKRYEEFYGDDAMFAAGWIPSLREKLSSLSEFVREIKVGFTRYYNKPANQFSLFGQLSVDYLSLNDKISDAKATGFGVTIAPGISYFVSDNFALEATVGLLSYNSVKPDGGESTNTFDTGLDFSNVSFGLVYKL